MLFRINGMGKLAITLFMAVTMIVLIVIVFKSARLQRIDVKMKRVIEEETSYDNLINEVELEAAYQEADMMSMRKDLYNLSPFYFEGKVSKQLNKTCAQFPSLYNIYFNNQYYQVMESTGGTYQLYGAYWDVRKSNKEIATVRILGQIDKVDPAVVLYCQLWYQGVNEPVVVPVTETRLVWNKKFGMIKTKAYYTYLISCAIPKKSQGKTPVSVSLVEKFCETATNNLKVNYNQVNRKESFAVCVKGLDFPKVDISVRLAEWIELLLILGASKVYFYNLQSHHNVIRLLEYYQSQDQVELTNITLSGYQPNYDGLQHFFMTNNKGRKRQDELVTYNDCFYKNMYNYDYITLLDIDEIIVPNVDYTWQELMTTTKAKVAKTKIKKRTSFAAQNVYFLDEFMEQHNLVEGVPDRYHLLDQFMEQHNLVEGVPDKYHMLQHIYRTQNYSKPGSYNKCFLDTEEVLTLHNHFPFSCFDKCSNYHMDKEDAQLNHYRDDCYSNLSSCREMKKNMVQDKVVHKYKDTLIARVDKVLKILNLK